MTLSEGVLPIVLLTLCHEHDVCPCPVLCCAGCAVPCRAALRCAALCCAVLCCAVLYAEFHCVLLESAGLSCALSCHDRLHVMQSVVWQKCVMAAGGGCCHQ